MNHGVKLEFANIVIHLIDDLIGKYAMKDVNSRRATIHFTDKYLSYKFFQEQSSFKKIRLIVRFRN